MVDERLEEGQLNNCDLTYRDLTKIKEAFLGILVGMYHSRIKYPGQDEKDGTAKAAEPKSEKNEIKGNSEVHANTVTETDNTDGDPSGSD